MHKQIIAVGVTNRRDKQKARFIAFVVPFAERQLKVLAIFVLTTTTTTTEPLTLPLCACARGKKK